MSKLGRRLQSAGPKGGTLYITPATDTYSNGSTLTITIRENSGSVPVNAVQANLSYPTNRLQFQSISTSTSAFTTSLQETGGGGTVQIGVGILGNSVTGDAIVATVTFQAIGAGAAAVQFTAGSGIAATADSSDICKQRIGANYTIS